VIKGSGPGHAFSLHFLSKISFPRQAFPLFLGGTHYLYYVYVPPPHLTVQLDHSLIIIQYPSSVGLSVSLIKV
jgi:hypothetical protein